MKIGLKTFLASVGLMVIFAIVGLYAALFGSTSKLHETVTNLGKNSKNIVAVHELEANLLSHSRESLLWKLTGHEIHRAKREQARLDYLSSIEQGRIFVESAPESELFRQIESSSKIYFEVRDRIESGDLTPERAAELIAPYTDHLLSLLREFANANLEQINTGQIRADGDDRTMKNTGILVSAFSFFAVLCTLMFIWRHLYLPLRRVIQSIEALAKGKLPPALNSRIEEVSLIGETLRESSLKLRHQKESHLRHIAAVAHDLKNPICAIKTSVEMIQDTAGLDDESRELVQIISRQSDYLLAMSSDFLDTSRAESGTLTIRKCKADLRKYVLDAARLFQNYSKMHNISVDVPARPVFCSFDFTRISQVLNNLISNSIKYTPSGGTITVTLTQVKASAVVSISDPGIGIDEKEIQTIFEPFRRSKHTFNTIPGVGLGLFTSRQIVLAHGGELTAESVFGNGSTFRMSIPAERFDSEEVVERSGVLKSVMMSKGGLSVPVIKSH